MSQGKHPAPHALTAGGALLKRLHSLGVEWVLANSGTDFPPLIEALAAAQAAGEPMPQALVVPHEHAAMGMAYGIWLATGRPQAVMVHTNVGLANCAIGAINAATERVPMLLFSGRTPVTERGRHGSRSIPIGWGQEMRDQAALVRETVKWEYELRFPEQAAELAERAHAIAMSTPKGPVYMSLPREVLAEPCPPSALEFAIGMRPAIAAPDPAAVAEAARILAAAERPLIIAQHGAGSAEAFGMLGRLTEAWAFPVVQFWANQLALSFDHPMCAGVDPEPWLGEADVVLVLGALSPWMPGQHAPAPTARVIQAGPDPLAARFPVRNFRADLSLVGETSAIVEALATALAPHAYEQQRRPSPAAAARRKLIAERREVRLATARKAAAAGSGSPMTRPWLAHCLREALAGRDASVVSELGVPFEAYAPSGWGSWYDHPHSGGLGWAFPTALGVKLAEPGRLVVATMGDGSYIFANPVACHMLSEALDLPMLVIVVNNREWGAVRRATLSMYPDGAAARANRMPLTSLTPSPDFCSVARASRAFAERVEDGRALPEALSRALAHIETRRTLALLDVIVAQ